MNINPSPAPTTHQFTTQETTSGDRGAYCGRCRLFLPVGAYWRLPDCQDRPEVAA